MGISDRIKKSMVKFSQKLVARAYRKEGLTDDVLDMQIQLNELRYDYNINDSDDEFVQ